jgi:hypothetical protein
MTSGSEISAPFQPPDPLSIDFRHIEGPEFALQHGERGFLGSAGALPTSFMSLIWKSIRSPRGFSLADAGNLGRLATVNLALGVNRPALGVLLADEVRAGRPALAADLDTPSPGSLFADIGHFCGANTVQ